MSEVNFMQVMTKGMVYHCRHCHKSYRYCGEVTGCSGSDCCHGADEPLTPAAVWKEYKKPKFWEDKGKKND